MTKGQFITGNYNQDHSITVWYRNEKGVKDFIRVVGFEPYFYVLANSFIPDDDRYKEVLPGYTGLYGEDLWRLVVSDPGSVPELRKPFIKHGKHFEADVTFVKRLLIDCGIYGGFTFPTGQKKVHYSDLKPVKFSLDPLVSFFDIEVYAKTRFPNPYVANQKIISSSVWDSKNKMYLTFMLSPKPKPMEKIGNWMKVYCETEEQVVSYTVEYFNKVRPDVTSGWNVYFDINYFKARCKRLKIPVDFGYTCIFDLCTGYGMLRKPLGKRLKEVVIEEGLTKEVVSEEFHLEYWERPETREKFMLYNMKDVEYCVKLDTGFTDVKTGEYKQYDITKFFWDLKNFVGQSDMENMTHGLLIDTLILRKAHGKYVLPSMPPRKERKKSFRAAVVFEPPEGVYGADTPYTGTVDPNELGVAVLDMSRFYPNIVKAYYAMRLRFSPDGKENLFPEMVDDLMELRELYEKIMSDNDPKSENYRSAKRKRNVIKSPLLSGIWGYIAWAGSRTFDRTKAAFIAGKAREGLLLAKDKSISFGFEILYGDSVSGDTELRIYKRSGHCESITIEKLWKEYNFNTETRPDGKEEIVFQPPFIDTLTQASKESCDVYYKRFHQTNHGGWMKKPILTVKYSPILRIVRHLTEKQMYEVITENTKVCVTSDHSLLKLNNNKECVKCRPTNLHKGDLLPSYFPYIFTKKQRENMSKGHNPKKIYKMSESTLRKRTKTVSMAMTCMKNSSRKILADITTDKWKDSDFVRKQMKSRNIRPNKLEKKFFSQFSYIEYVGDGSLVIGGKCPDFKVVGKNKLIEVFGDYWHENENSQDRIDFFKLYGFETLVLWENEIHNMTTKLRNRIIRFINSNSLYPSHEKVIAIKKLGKTKEYVYDLEVKDSHQFWANGIFVHNTDSILPLVKLKNVPFLVNKLNKVFTEYCEKEGISSLLSIKMDRFYRKALWIRSESKGKGKGTQKKYMGHCVQDGDKKVDFIDTKGFEMIRGDSSKITRRLQADAGDAILRKGTEGLIERIQKLVKEIEEGKHSHDDVAIAKTLHKKLNAKNKKGKLTNIDYYRGARYGNKYLGFDIVAGDRVKMLYVKRVKGYPSTNVICYLDQDKLPEIVADYKYMINRTVRGKVERMLKVGGMSWQAVEGIPPLESFWGVQK